MSRQTALVSKAWWLLTAVVFTFSRAIEEVFSYVIDMYYPSTIKNLSPIKKNRHVHKVRGGCERGRVVKGKGVLL